MRYSEQAVLGGDASWASGSIEAGTVGWDDDADHYDTAPGEVVLVKVTLFRGRNPDRDPEPKPGRAGGLQILARVSAPMQTIPPDGAEVIVAVPAVFGLTPGAPVILAQVAVAPPNQFSATRAKLDFGPDVDVVIKARSVTLTDYEDRFFTLGPRFGIKMGDAGANGMQLKGGKWCAYVAQNGDAKAVWEMSATDLKISQKNASDQKVNFKLKDGTFTLACDVNFIAIYQMGWLGASSPVPVPPPLPVAAGPTPGTVSSNTFVSLA